MISKGVLTSWSKLVEIKFLFTLLRDKFTMVLIQRSVKNKKKKKRKEGRKLKKAPMTISDEIILLVIVISK